MGGGVGEREVAVAPDVRQMPASTKEPLVQEGMRLLPQVQALPLDERPMIWSDLLAFEAKHARNAQDMTYDLGMHVRSDYLRAVRTHVVLPFDIELLVRLYDRYPSSCMWKRPTLREVFNLVYGRSIELFAEDLRPRAMIAYGQRFARMLGRTPTVHYRWLVDEAARGKTAATRRVRNIAAKLLEAHLKGDDARQVLESIAVPMWLRRGLDVQAAAPAFDPAALQARIRKRASLARVAERVRVRLERNAHAVGHYTGGAFVPVDE